jgi:hypothetical protein
LGCTFYELLYNEPFVLSNSTVANLKYAYTKLQNENDKNLRILLINMLHPCESMRYNIWQVLESDYFKTVKSKSEDLNFPLCYNNLKFNNTKDHALFLKKKLEDIKDLRSLEHSSKFSEKESGSEASKFSEKESGSEASKEIPDYIYEILCMKISNRKIEKSHFSLLDSQIFLNEKIILEKINKDKIILYRRLLQLD